MSTNFMEHLKALIPPPAVPMPPLVFSIFNYLAFGFTYFYCCPLGQCAHAALLLSCLVDIPSGSRLWEEGEVFPVAVLPSKPHSLVLHAPPLTARMLVLWTWIDLSPYLLSPAIKMLRHLPSATVSSFFVIQFDFL